MDTRDLTSTKTGGAPGVLEEDNRFYRKDWSEGVGAFEKKKKKKIMQSMKMPI